MLGQITSIAGVLLLAGCATTVISNKYVDPQFRGPIDSVMVMGITAKEGNRAAFEQEFATLFQNNGVRSVQSRIAIPRIQAVTDKQVKDIVRREGVQTVFIARIVNVSKENNYVAPGFVYYRPYYSPYYINSAWSPGYVTTNTTIHIEVTLHDVTTDKLVWSATSESFNPTKIGDVIDELGRTVVEQFRKDSLL